MSAEPRKATVLVVDDNDANRALARDVLDDEGYRVVLEANGASGLAAFEREQPDCVLLDVRMPDVDGFTVCERIRTLPGGADVPVLFFTALRDVDTFDRALASGGTDFLTKPVRPGELLVRIETALTLRRTSAELREQYDLFKRQRDHLQRVQLQKERLMAFVVHDLKVPVGTLDLYAQLVLREKTLSPAARDAAQQIRTEARQLNRMILNLLDLSKADEGKLVPATRPVALAELVAEVIADQEPRAAAQEVTLVANAAPIVAEVDEDLVRRMLQNLVDNAVRYSPSGGRVTVSVVERDQGEIELRVADVGRGVPVEARDRIFDAFAQVDANGQVVERSSRGLGLTFCKLVAEAHQGRIWVDDGAPGAIFCVRLSRAPG